MKSRVFILLGLMSLGFLSCDESPSISSYPTIEQYFERNNITESDYQITSSGLIYIINKEGTGDLAKFGETVTVHYSGYHLDDSKFDSSYDRNEAFVFRIGDNRIIAGWNEGLQYFRKGGSGTLYIPWELAYGESGSGPITPKEDLKFDINLLAID
ncbi:MAG: FKBP-type peptidyl-prolyl cis-trans isomerase [Reichenbachiella sp.]|uniref:FKBP-type peptidyl-prolyl cis-trans isomerase n=1 Tax=Reichenbachiella sp. TaxID=2184521 RepID=UPI002966C99C|nr:FKBP-type peptidyl-prolyl cis-trans isomerase [Reichenbachiella sp.]MDW3211954.1 FKBP-type peptidyl-prolyl cis-trans isomerase [Reichenbachiella sp.]